EAVGCVGEIPYRTIIEQGYKLEIGYFAWEWGPGNRDCASLDMTEDGTFATLHAWGLEVAVTDPYSIQKRAVRPASILNAEPAPLIPAAIPAGDLPDLTITGITWTPEQPKRDDPVIFSVTVENRGSAALPGATPLRLAFIVNGENLPAVEMTADIIPPGETRTFQVDAAPWAAVPGFFIVYAAVESPVTERDRFNNMLTAVGTVRLGLN
ncbi:MAG: hypothetical protein K8I30_24855, partial [Anaerolineae bacterium]|nr:hypothetical protein [Anaerolineae bacterium]